MKLGSYNYYKEKTRQGQRIKWEEGCYFRLNKKRYLSRDLNGLRQLSYPDRSKRFSGVKKSAQRSRKDLVNSKRSKKSRVGEEEGTQPNGIKHGFGETGRDQIVYAWEWLWVKCGGKPPEGLQQNDLIWLTV